jgi:hypothetical protein
MCWQREDVLEEGKGRVEIREDVLDERGRVGREGKRKDLQNTFL